MPDALLARTSELAAVLREELRVRQGDDAEADDETESKDQAQDEEVATVDHYNTSMAETELTQPPEGVHDARRAARAPARGARPDDRRDRRARDPAAISQIEPALYVWITTAYLVASTVLVPIYGKLSDLYGRTPHPADRDRHLPDRLVRCAACRRRARQLIAFARGAGHGLGGPVHERVRGRRRSVPAGRARQVAGHVRRGVRRVERDRPADRRLHHRHAVGWHWAFFINLPIGAIAIGFIVARMPPLKTARDGQAASSTSPARSRSPSPSLPLLLALSLGHVDRPRAIRTGRGRRGRSSGCSRRRVAGIAAFVAIEQRAASPILDIGAVQNKTFAVGSLAAFVVGGAFLGAIVFLPLFMVNVVGLSQTQLRPDHDAAHVRHRRREHHGRAARVEARLVQGPVARLARRARSAAFCCSRSRSTPESTQLSVTREDGRCSASASGPSIPLFTLAIQNAVPPQQIGVATAAATFFRQMGATIGIAIVGTVFATSFASDLQTNLAEATRDMPADAPRIVLQQGSPGRRRRGRGGAFDAAKIKAQRRREPRQPPEHGAPHAKEVAHANVDDRRTRSSARSPTRSSRASGSRSASPGSASWSRCSFRRCRYARRSAPSLQENE